MHAELESHGCEAFEGLDLIEEEGYKANAFFPPSCRTGAPGRGRPVRLGTPGRSGWIVILSSRGGARSVAFFSSPDAPSPLRTTVPPHPDNRAIYTPLTCAVPLLTIPPFPRNHPCLPSPHHGLSLPLGPSTGKTADRAIPC